VGLNTGGPLEARPRVLHNLLDKQSPNASAPCMGATAGWMAKNAIALIYRSIAHVHRTLAADNAALNDHSRQVRRGSPAIAYPTGCRYSTVPTPESGSRTRIAHRTTREPSQRAFATRGRFPGTIVASTARYVDATVSAVSHRSEGPSQRGPIRALPCGFCYAVCRSGSRPRFRALLHSTIS
jgi:hypothetical protein